MKLFLVFRIMLLVILIAIGIKYSFINFLNMSFLLSVFLGIFIYLAAYIISYFINYYPDPVLNKNLTSEQLSKLILRKFYRSIGFKYITVCSGLYFFMINGFNSLGLLLGIAISVVSFSVISSLYIKVF